MDLPDILLLAMRFVATSFIVLCEAPDDLIADIRHALVKEIIIKICKLTMVSFQKSLRDIYNSYKL